MDEQLELKQLTICTYCNSVFESPVLLPCSETMCEKHVDEMKLKDSAKEEIRCHFCNEFHEIPKNGFSKDKRTAKLIELEFHLIDFGGSHSTATSLCKDLSENIQKYESLTKEPEHFIDEYFKKLINEIDIRREETKLAIDKWHEDRLKEIQSYKDEYLTKFCNNLPQENQMIEEFKKKYNCGKKSY